MVASGNELEDALVKIQDALQRVVSHTLDQSAGEGLSPAEMRAYLMLGKVCKATGEQAGFYAALTGQEELWCKPLGRAK